VCLRVGWICLVAVGVAILAFGVIAAIVPMSADGVASIGVGLFGVMITLVPFRRRERWAWFALWFYPAFWVMHLVGRLPPGKDHVHQVVLIVLSLTGLLLPVREFFGTGVATGAMIERT